MTSLVMTSKGMVLGLLETTNVYSFKGIRFAAPPVGDLRWKTPQPMPPWSGIREAVRFSPRTMQLPVFCDMNFRSNGMSEDGIRSEAGRLARLGGSTRPRIWALYDWRGLRGRIEKLHLARRTKSTCPNDSYSAVPPFI